MWWSTSTACLSRTTRQPFDEAKPTAGFRPIADIRQTSDGSLMNRRTLLALAASLPTFAAAPAMACSVALKSPRSAGLENQQVHKLFEAWWDRDVAKFRSYFTDTLMADGTAMEPKLARELTTANSIPIETYAIFDRFFTDKRKLNRVNLIVNTDAGVIVACSETDARIEIQPNCTGMPKLHLFLVKMLGLNPRSIAHLATTETVEVDRFSIWTEGSA